MSTQREGETKFMRASIVTHPAEQAHPTKQTRHWRGWWEVLPAIFGFVWFVIAFFPILYMISTSLRQLSGFLTESPWLPPPHPTLGNYIYVLSNSFGLYFVNSVFVTVISVGVIVTISLFAAYAISKIRNRFTQFVF